MPTRQRERAQHRRADEQMRHEVGLGNGQQSPEARHQPGLLELPGARVGEGLGLQGDGRLVLVGRAIVAEERRLAVMRLDGDGTPDDTFGDGALVTTDVADQGDAATALAIQPDGMIVQGGFAQHDVDGYGLARVLP